MKAQLKSFVKNVINRFLVRFNTFRYSQYDSDKMKDSLMKLGIQKGDSLFIMCSSDRMQKQTGRSQPVHLIINQIVDLLGKEGTVMALSFSSNRNKIVEGEQTFHWRRTPSADGVFSELIRRRKGSMRSLHPTYSAVAIGKRAEEYCKSHQDDIYPFGSKSPFRKIIEANGKYLGVQLDFNQFTLVHCVDDYYRDNFIHKLFEPEVKEFKVESKGGEEFVRTLVRKTGQELRDAIPNPNGEEYFRKLQPIDHSFVQDPSGIKLFLLDLNSFFKSAIENYDKSKLTWWNTDI